MSKLCYFLIFRRSLSAKEKINWKRPTGGLVVDPVGFDGEIPIANMGFVLELSETRYHCGPDEELIIAEVFTKNDQRLAWTLHAQWEREAHEFQELMETT